MCHAAKERLASPDQDSCSPANHTGGSHAPNCASRAIVSACHSLIDQLYNPPSSNTAISPPCTYTETRANKRAGSRFSSAPCSARMAKNTKKQANPEAAACAPT